MSACSSLCRNVLAQFHAHSMLVIDAQGRQHRSDLLRGQAAFDHADGGRRDGARPSYRAHPGGSRSRSITR
jgi:hypothetical protein